MKILILGDVMGQSGRKALRENLKKTISNYKAESGLAIVMDITSGQILSSVSLPDFNPEDKSSFNNNNLITTYFAIKLLIKN